MAVNHAHVFISGRVQGVSFRYYTYHEALKLGLHGWVRNLHDGRVEAVFEGEKPAVEKILEWCKQGPVAARVEEVAVEWGEPAGLSEGFGVRPTGSTS
jgi:acylphosphatase